MSQKSSVPQAAKSVSQALMSDRCSWNRCRRPCSSQNSDKIRVFAVVPRRPNQGHIAAAKLFGIKEVPTVRPRISARPTQAEC
jgi:hypothetical protein